jgi:hypothetical protein
VQAVDKRIAEHVPIVARPAKAGDSGQVPLFDQEQQRVSEAIRVVGQHPRVIHCIRPESEPSAFDAMLVHLS